MEEVVIITKIYYLTYSCKNLCQNISKKGLLAKLGDCRKISNIDLELVEEQLFGQR